jgi:hypothetical protein
VAVKKKQYVAPQLRRREKLAKVTESTQPVVTDGRLVQ